MKDSLKSGLTYTFKYRVPENKTVPYLFPEISELQVMPKVLATGFMVGLMEWTCLQAIMPYLDWPHEQSVGIAINVNHIAATPPGLTVTVNVKLEKIEGRKLTFSIKADDGIDVISTGTHQRFIIDAPKFNAKIIQKRGSNN